LLKGVVAFNLIFSSPHIVEAFGGLDGVKSAPSSSSAPSDS